PERLRVTLLDRRDRAVRRPRGAAQQLLRLGLGLARGQRVGHHRGLAQLAGHAVGEARYALALLAQFQQGGDRGLAVAVDERVGERPDLALARRRAGLLDLVGTDRGALAVFERELLELASEPLLAVAHLGDQRARRIAVEPEAELLALLDHPGRQLLALDVHLRGDLAARLVDRVMELRGRLVAALLAGEEGNGERLRVGGGERGR